MPKHYVLVLAPHQDGWLARLPDFPDCSAIGPQVEPAIAAAAERAVQAIARLRQASRPIPEPRSLEDIRADPSWSVEHAIDWTRAVVSLVPITGT